VIFYLYFVSHIALVVTLNLADAETIVHALITSHLDYCNALFSLPKKQKIKNIHQNATDCTKCCCGSAQLD